MNEHSLPTDSHTAVAIHIHSSIVYMGPYQHHQYYGYKPYPYSVAIASVYVQQMAFISTSHRPSSHGIFTFDQHIYVHLHYNNMQRSRSAFIVYIVYHINGIAFHSNILRILLCCCFWFHRKWPRMMQWCIIPLIYLEPIIIIIMIITK